MKTLPFYYGWIIMAAGAIGILCSVPGQTMGVSVYTDHLIQHLSISRIEISTAYMIGTLLSALVMTRAGMFYDYFGARVAAAAAAVGLGLCLIFLSRSLNLSLSLSELLGVEMSSAAFGLMIIGFFGIRFFGQGVLTLISRGMVMRWFEAHRGFVAALMGIFTSFGFSYAPRALQGLINLTDWKRSWLVMGIILLGAVLPFILIFFRDSPEDCDMKMEEGLKIRTGSKGGRKGDAPSKTLKEAKRDPRLWCYLALLFFWALYNTAFTFHITSIFSSLGKDTAQAVAIFLPISIISVAARFLGSWLSDMIDLKYHFYLLDLAILLGAISLALPYNGVTSFTLILGMGVGAGIFGVLNSITWPKLYGREHLGAISGLAMSFIVAGSALGPWVFSIMEKIWGHYRFTGIMGASAAVLIGLASLPFLLSRRSFSKEKAWIK